MGFFKQIETLDQVPQFNVEKVKVFDANNREIPNTYSLQRDDNNEHLGMVKENYRPIQMDEMVDILNTASNNVGDIEHVAYAFARKGRQVVIQSKLAEDINVDGDILKPYFYTVIDNSGKGSNKTIPSTQRIACMNAFHLIKSSALDRSLHNTNFDDKVETMTDNIINSVNRAKNFTSIIERLKGLSYTKKDMQRLSENLIPVKKEESTNRVNKRAELLHLFSQGLGNSGRTRWDALNAITEYETHKGKKTPEKLVHELTVSNTLSKKGFEILVA